MLSAIAQRLGVDERDATPLPGRLAAALRARQLLILLDNFEHLLAARDSVLALLEACPRLVMLVTSRVALDVRGGREYPVAPLVAARRGPSRRRRWRGSPAVQLFVERARATGAGPDRWTPGRPRAVAEICRRLEGLPLAIELAAARTRLLPPAALLDQAGPPAAGAGRRPARPAGPAADHAGRDRLELRAAGRAGAGAVPADVRVHRRLHPGRGRGDLRGRPATRPAVLDGLAALAASSLLRLDAPAAPGRLTVRRGAPAGDHAGDDPRIRQRAARRRIPKPGRSGSGTPPTTWPWPRRRPPRWPGPGRRPGWRGWTPSTTTCGPPCAGPWTGVTG